MGGGGRALPSEGRGLYCGGGEADSEFAEDEDDADDDADDDNDDFDNDTFWSGREEVPTPAEEEGRVEPAPGEEEGGGWDSAIWSPSTLL